MKLLLQEVSITDEIYSDWSRSIFGNDESYAFKILGSDGYFLVSDSGLDPDLGDLGIEAIELSNSIPSPFSRNLTFDDYSVAERFGCQSSSGITLHTMTHTPEVFLYAGVSGQVSFDYLGFEIQFVDDLLREEDKFFSQMLRVYEQHPDEFDAEWGEQNRPSVESVAREFEPFVLDVVLSSVREISGSEFFVTLHHQFDSDDFRWSIELDTGDDGSENHSFSLSIPMEVAALQSLHGRLVRDFYEAVRLSLPVRLHRLMKAPFDHDALQESPRYFIPSLQPHSMMQRASLRFINRN